MQMFFERHFALKWSQLEGIVGFKENIFNMGDTESIFHLTEGI